MRFTLEESMAELSELAGTAGLEVAGSTYQRVLEPNPRTYIGTGKVRLLRGLRGAARCAGFGSRPTMVKEARVLCVSCRTCGAMVSFLLGLLEGCRPENVFVPRFFLLLEFGGPGGGLDASARTKTGSGGDQSSKNLRARSCGV